MKKMLIVGGTFEHLDDPNEYKDSNVSSVILKFTEYMDEHSGFECDWVNGGALSILTDDLKYSRYDVIIWMPNISNDEDKILPRIKEEAPRALLISSKRVVEKEYKESDVIGRLLKSKSNLGIMITKPKNLYKFKLLDPLGNLYVDTCSIEELADTILNRINQLFSMTRVPSKKIDEEREFTIDPEFIEFVKYSANEFTKYVNAVNPNRLLGNASTRCMFGFPAERQQDRIFVTQRNIDKKLIETDGFVEVSPEFNGSVLYYGDRKPSVDTPIQVKLFNYYPNINYMVHGHVYIEGAKMTSSKVPCGFLEEFDEVVELYPSPDEEVVVVNLRGHGCLIMTRTVDQLWKYGSNYISREFPEY